MIKKSSVYVKEGENVNWIRVKIYEWKIDISD